MSRSRRERRGKEGQIVARKYVRRKEDTQVFLHHCPHSKGTDGTVNIHRSQLCVQGPSNQS